MHWKTAGASATTHSLQTTTGVSTLDDHDQGDPIISSMDKLTADVSATDLLPLSPAPTSMVYASATKRNARTQATAKLKSKGENPM